MLDFLEKNGFGHRTGQGIPSGYCVFPVFEFNADKIKSVLTTVPTIICEF